MVLDSHTRAARNDDDVDVRLKRFQYGCRSVANQAREVDESSIPLDECGKHWTVRIGNLKATGRRPGGQQFVSCYSQTHARTPDHVHVSVADRTEHAQILRTQDATGLE